MIGQIATLTIYKVCEFVSLQVCKFAGPKVCKFVKSAKFVNVVKFLKPYSTGSEYDKMLGSNLRIIFENDLNYSIEKLRGGGSWDEIWRSVNEKLIGKWKKEYGITHVIRENELPLDFSVTYKNEYYTIYDLRL